MNRSEQITEIRADTAQIRAQVSAKENESFRDFRELRKVNRITGKNKEIKWETTVDSRSLLRSHAGER